MSTLQPEFVYTTKLILGSVHFGACLDLVDSTIEILHQMKVVSLSQFDEGVLEACLFVLDNSEVPPSGRGNPVSVVRVISAMVSPISPDNINGTHLVKSAVLFFFVITFY